MLNSVHLFQYADTDQRIVQQVVEETEHMAQNQERFNQPMFLGVQYFLYFPNLTNKFEHPEYFSTLG